MDANPIIELWNMFMIIAMLFVIIILLGIVVWILGLSTLSGHGLCRGGVDLWRRADSIGAC